MLRADHLPVRLRRRVERSPDFDRVLLLVEDMGSLGARVNAARSGVADLELDDPGISGALDGVVATMITVGDARLEGRLVTGDRPRHVRFLSRPRSRRAHVRAPLKRDLMLVPDRLDGIWRVRTRNLGAGGALVGDGAELPLGARVQVQLALEVTDAPLRTPGRIIRAPSSSLRVVLFEQVDSSVADLVAREIEQGRRSHD